MVEQQPSEDSRTQQQERQHGRVSLRPGSFEDALRALLNMKPRGRDSHRGNDDTEQSEWK